MVKLGICAAEFHWDIVGEMVEFAKRHADFLGAEIVEEKIVPGTFELPLAAKRLVERDDIDAVVALGAVIEGDTGHHETVMQQASRKIMDISLETGKPVSLGVSGPGETRMEAEERIDEYARRAVEAAVKSFERL
ncbi:6,7-dimethyl-8-ribityllumazine synthase [candidate division MSBL1 archaeon SCGC-AAA259M10]|uniref:6,7-dimethyl-8-ribityllumazine synthase n=3 Tax=candidate division MSBL1 TaxID=215777 RepID=A0A656YWL3_9EURY|nr:6,7-dimethyl-8-ribityllumazine synthase [candidate division MSBL1 archaeon SCGC-AAA259B11]KXA98476.1 6,7-dimethyl-8-ribityllumazine synthase [candidate division MSBL1 archaeon SCGC-AAA259J03]KXB00583.1 6,7-dimethyl-8-ribityllumazine synthase [candidate division MSBL1 archaeon SCGC-AAA259M10]